MGLFAVVNTVAAIEEYVLQLLAGIIALAAASSSNARRLVGIKDPAFVGGIDLSGSVGFPTLAIGYGGSAEELDCRHQQHRWLYGDR